MVMPMDSRIVAVRNTTDTITDIVIKTTIGMEAVIIIGTVIADTTDRRSIMGGLIDMAIITIGIIDRASILIIEHPAVTMVMDIDAMGVSLL